FQRDTPAWLSYRLVVNDSCCSRPYCPPRADCRSTLPASQLLSTRRRSHRGCLTKLCLPTAFRRHGPIINRGFLCEEEHHYPCRCRHDQHPGLSCCRSTFLEHHWHACACFCQYDAELIACHYSISIV